MWHVLVAGQDLTTAACGTLNAAYFLHYLLRRSRSPRRRLGAAALVGVNVAVVVESLFFLALYTSWHRLGTAEPFLWPQVWLPARLPLLVGAAIISILVVRQQRR
jgi:ABC-type Co2+ transport system permease subunit